jgi:hypothetical protein
LISVPALISVNDAPKPDAGRKAAATGRRIA